MRTNPFVDLQRITELAPQLQPHTLKDAVKDWTRGGLPAQSIPEGSRSSGPPLPGFDRVDRMLRQAEKDCYRSINLALQHLQAALYFQTSVLNPAEPVPEPEEFPCSNIRCAEPLEQGRQTGECSKCRVHRHRNDGLAWPLKVEGAA